MNTPVEHRFGHPFQHPCEIPVKSVKNLVNTLLNTPVNTPVNTLVTTAVDTPFCTFLDTFVHSLENTPVNTFFWRGGSWKPQGPTVYTAGRAELRRNVCHPAHRSWKEWDRPRLPWHDLPKTTLQSFWLLCTTQHALPTAEPRRTNTCSLGNGASRVLAVARLHRNVAVFLNHRPRFFCAQQAGPLLLSGQFRVSCVN